MSREALDPELRAILVCPRCRGALADASGGSALYCAACAFTFPIVDGIPVMFPTDVAGRFDELFRRYWDSEERAEIYDSFVEGERSMMGLHHHVGEMRATLEMLGDAEGPLLDCGCGNGRFFEHYPRGVKAFGIDASLNLLRICRSKGRCERLVCGELEHLPFADGSFAHVVSVRVLQHLRQQREAVREMVRVARDGGRLVVHCYNDWSSKALVKRLRESRLQPALNAPFRALFRSLSPFPPWGLEYDAYNDPVEVRRWLEQAGAEVTGRRGSGFGFNKWLLDGFLVASWLEKNRPRWLAHYLDWSLRAEETLGRAAPANLVMEKFVLRAAKRSFRPARRSDR